MNSWKKNKTLHVTSLTVLTLSFSILILFSITVTNLNSVLLRWGKTLQLTAYVKENVNEIDLAKMQIAMQQLQGVEHVELITKSQASKILSQKMGSYAPDAIKDLQFSEALPASLVLSISQNASLNEADQKLQLLADQVAKLDGVESYSFGRDWLTSYAKMFRSLSIFLICVGVTLLLGSFFAIATVIKTSVYGRRDEIEILEMIGANASMIRAPYLQEGAILGGVSVIISLFFSVGIFQFGKSFVVEHLEFIGFSEYIKFLNWPWIVLFIVLGIASGLAASYLSVKDILQLSLRRSRENVI